MEQLERFAGKLAHDFNRLITRSDAEDTVEGLAAAAPLVAQLTDELAQYRFSAGYHGAPSLTQAAATDGRRRVLVVDSDAAERGQLRDMLDPGRYDVIEAASGSDALACCQPHADPVHVMLTDVLLDDMSGRELAERAGLWQPGMNVIYVSGYTTDDIVFYGILGPGVATLEKPVRPEMLAERLREALELAHAATA